MCLYVNDILIFGTNINVTNDVKSFLSQNYDMKDIEQAKMTLNIKIIKESDKIIMFQSHYIE